MNYLNEFILFFICLTEVIIVYDFYNDFLERKEGINTCNIIFFSGIIVTVFFIISLQRNTQLNLIAVCILFWIYINIIFSSSFKKKIVYYMLSILILWGCEFLFGILMYSPSYFLKTNSLINIAEMSWQIFLLSLLAYIIFSIIKQISHKSKNQMKNSIFFMFIIVPILSFLIMLSAYYLGNLYIKNHFIQMLLAICFFVILLENRFFFLYFNKYLKEKDNNVKNSNIIAKQNTDMVYYHDVEMVNEKYNEIIHDINHYFKTIGELIKANQNSSVEKILTQLGLKLEHSALEIYCSDHIINAILNEKKNDAEKKGVKLDAYVEPGVMTCGVAEIDIIAILGNLLDNAILAAQGCEYVKNVSVRIFMQNRGNFIVMKVYNNFSGELIKISRGYITTKKDKRHHGFGIQSVKNTAEKYGGYLECLADRDVFTAILILPYKFKET